jgi:hypothetical protein
VEDDFLPGCFLFSLRGKRLNVTRPQRLGRFYDNDYRLAPIVAPPMPHLVGEVEGLSQNVQCGAIVSCALILHNASDCELSTLSLVLGEAPQVVRVGRPVRCDSDGQPLDRASSSRSEHILEEAEPEGKGTGVGAGATAAAAAKISSGRRVRCLDLPLPDGKPFRGRDRLRVPLWIHPQEAGQSALRFLLAYEGSEVDRRLPFRVVRLAAQLNVQQSVVAQASLRRDPTSPTAAVLSLRVQNHHPQSAVMLQDVQCLAPDWRIVGICGGNIEQRAIESARTLALHLRCERLPKPAGAEEQALSPALCLTGGSVVAAGASEGVSWTFARAAARMLPIKNTETEIPVMVRWCVSGLASGSGSLPLQTYATALDPQAALATISSGRMVVLYQRRVKHDFSAET